MQARGIFLTVLSAVLYGLNPLFSKTINVGGCNSLTQTFARLAAGIVIFFILLVCSGNGSVREKLRLSRQELKDILICCIGYGLIGPLLFASYNYLASGLATTLHFVYPVLVVVACIAFRYERANRRKLVCCALCFAGILCFYTPGGDVSAYVFLALASGVAWAYYIVHLNSSGLVTMAPFKLAFWLCVFSAVLVGGITLAMGEFVWPSTAFTRGALALYCCVSTAASLLFQLGNRFIGAQSASMLSTFEPLTSVVIGILVYHEVLTVRLGIGIFCILLAVFLLAKADGTVCKHEISLLDKIANLLGIDSTTYQSIKAMYYDDLDSAYSILGITSSATDEEVKKAYRKMAIENHPDKVGYMGEDIRKAAEKKFMTINEAYEKIKKQRGIN